VPDVAVDVVAEGAHGHADLGSGHPGAPRQLDAVDEVGHQRTHTVIDLLDRRAHGPQHRVAEDPDLASCHQAALARRPSISSAASSRAACRVSGCRLAKTIDPPPAIWVSYGIRTTLLARVRKW